MATGAQAGLFKRFRAGCNGGESYGRLLRRTEERDHGSQAGGRLMDRATSVEMWSIVLRAEARLGLVAPLRLLGGTAPARVR